MASDEQLREAMATTMQGFAQVVAKVEPHHLELPTPCTEWSVFNLVDHVVSGERFTEMTLKGMSLEDAVASHSGVDPNDSDLVAQVTKAAADVLVAFQEPLDRVIAHPIGPVVARRVLGFRIIDQLGHTWDLATAIGQAVVLDPAALAVGLEIVDVERETLERSSNFVTLPDEPTNDPQAAFLGAIGREAPDAP